MNFEQFKTIIELLEQVRERSHSIYKLGIDLMDYDESNHKIISMLMDSVFKEEGKDWIDWYLYEKPGFKGKSNLATDENGNEICYDVKSLWQTVKPYRKQ